MTSKLEIALGNFEKVEPIEDGIALEFEHVTLTISDVMVSTLVRALRT